MYLFAIESGDISASLQEVVVPILSNSECRKSGYGERRITDNMLCAGFKDGEKDSCQGVYCGLIWIFFWIHYEFPQLFWLKKNLGDSGGPLHVKNETLYQVVGIVSWGEGCAQPDYPGVYTRYV